MLISLPGWLIATEISLAGYQMNCLSLADWINILIVPDMFRKRFELIVSEFYISADRQQQYEM